LEKAWKKLGKSLEKAWKKLGKSLGILLHYPSTSESYRVTLLMARQGSESLGSP
jgi:hypothetical protein